MDRKADKSGKYFDIDTAISFLQYYREVRDEIEKVQVCKYNELYVEGRKDAEDRFIKILENLKKAAIDIVHCEECIHQDELFHEDRRRKDGGFYCYLCDICSEGYEADAVHGRPGNFCSSGERRTNV